MIFVPTIINNPIPALAVTAADSGVPAVTYNQIRQSFGTQVYNVEGLYIYSTNINQILGVIQYQRFDSTGQQEYHSIATTVDPYQLETAINVDLSQSNTMFILNGNSSFAANILPNTYVQVKVITKRITNSFGNNLLAFKEMERIFRKPNFFSNYGEQIKLIEDTNKKIRDSISNKKLQKTNKNLEKVDIKLSPIEEENDNKKIIVISLLSLGIISFGIYVLNRE